MIRASLLCLLAILLAACAREPVAVPREAAAYPGQPVRTVVGTNYAATTGLPVPPANADGVVPAPPPRYLGDSAEASSANVIRP